MKLEDVISPKELDELITEDECVRFVGTLEEGFISQEYIDVFAKHLISIDQVAGMYRMLNYIKIHLLRKEGRSVGID
jgi:hypothetical protein